MAPGFALIDMRLCSESSTGKNYKMTNADFQALLIEKKDVETMCTDGELQLYIYSLLDGCPSRRLIWWVMNSYKEPF